MPRILALLALLLALTACGDSEPTADTAPEQEVAEVTQVELVSGTAAGGEVTSTPTRLPDDAAVREYAEQLGADLGADVVAAAGRAEVPAGRELAAAVVAISCDVPPRVTGTGTGDDVAVEAVLPSPNTKQCFAPITTVALVLLPA